MKKNTILALLIAVGSLFLAASRVHAQADIPQPCVFAATILINSTNYTYNGNAYNQPVPTVMRMTTKDVINILTNYYATPVPSTAKLVRVFGTSFEIDDAANNTVLSDNNGVLYLDTSEVPVWTAVGTDDYSTAGSETDYGVATFSIYDKDNGGSTDLTMTGFSLATLKTSVISASTGLVKVSQAFSMKTGTGVCVIGNGDPSGNAVVTGSFSSKGTGSY